MLALTFFGFIGTIEALFCVKKGAFLMNSLFVSGQYGNFDSRRKIV